MSRPPRIVLDTNLILSALLFGGGTTLALRRGWQGERFVPLVSRATAGELIRVLTYPKFRLDAAQREDLLALDLASTFSCPIVTASDFLGALGAQER